jgi:putative ABC transport system permease protein
MSPVWRQAQFGGCAVLRDLRFGLRMLRRNIAFTLIAVSTLALAIAANVAIFSVTSAALLRPFFWPEPERLVNIQFAGSGNAFASLTLRRYKLLRDKARSFETACWTNDTFNLIGAGEPVQLPVARVSPNFFSPCLPRGVFATIPR